MAAVGLGDEFVIEKFWGGTARLLQEEVAPFGVRAYADFSPRVEH